MADTFNTGGGMEVSPGPRGHSIDGVELSPDGTIAYFKTDKPSTLNGIPLPLGPRGFRGFNGDPGEARIRVDTTVGTRVFLWDAALASERMVHGDTGMWLLDDGTTWLRRSGNSVESNATDPLTLPEGFRPAASGFTWQFLTNDPWPTQVYGTITVPAVDLTGLVGYTAAAANGYPGTAEEWMNMVYRVVLPPEGDPGQVLTRTDVGSDWLDLPRIGPGPWINITLTSTWKPSTGQVAQVRLNNGTVEMIGDVTYTGPATTAGIWGGDYVKIGTLPPDYAPEAHYDVPCRTYKGLPGSANTPVMARIDIDLQGQLYLAAFDMAGEISLPVLANHTKVNLGALPSYPLRNSSNGL